MSEPVIKPKAWMCGRCHNELGMTPQEIGRFNCHCRRRNDPTPDTPLYTRDDLVRVAEAACKRWNSSTQDDIDKWNAEMLVDRLTKGET